MKKIKIYVGINQSVVDTIKFPIPFLKNPNDEKSKLGDVLETDRQGFSIIQLNEEGEKYFATQKNQFSCSYIPENNLDK